MGYEDGMVQDTLERAALSPRPAGGGLAAPDAELTAPSAREGAMTAPEWPVPWRWTMAQRGPTGGDAKRPLRPLNVTEKHPATPDGEPRARGQKRHRPDASSAPGLRGA